MSWALFKKFVNDNFKYPLNKQRYVPYAFGDRCMWFLENSTFTVPFDGLYTITCVGKGGTGGGKVMQYGSTFYSGGGGGGGAVTRGTYRLKAGEVYDVTVGSPSAFGELISAGGGGNGSASTSSSVAGVGGICLIPGNIFAYDGQKGAVGARSSSGGKGGDAGLTTRWSKVPSSYSGKGYIPFITHIDIFGKGSTGASFNGASGGAGGGGYGGGGQGGNALYVSSYGQVGEGGTGGAGLVIVEHGLELLG